MHLRVADDERGNAMSGWRSKRECGGNDDVAAPLAPSRVIVIVRKTLGDDLVITSRALGHQVNLVCLTRCPSHTQGR